MIADENGICSDGPLQLPITSLGDSLNHLYEHLCALNHARIHGPESEWVGSPSINSGGGGGCNLKLTRADYLGYSGNAHVWEKD